jgi:hypothetical protein
MLPKIKIREINYTQLITFNRYLQLCKTFSKKYKSNSDLCVLSNIFAVHIKLSNKLMFVQNSKKIIPVSFPHHEAYAILGYYDLTRTNIKDPYLNAIMINITSQIQKQLA